MPDRAGTAPDEFAWIDKLRSLTRGDPRALNLMDDAAVLPSRPGFELVISTDAMVEGVHFLAGEVMDIVARRLLRTSLSDLAAKAAEPFGYFLTVAWPARFGEADRERFIAGLDEDGRRFGVVLLGGDTVSTPGPLTASTMVLGWVPTGRMIGRAGARAGDLCVVCGPIGDGWLGLRAARGEIADPGGELARRYRLPEPLFALGAALRDHASAAADVSDGLLADALHIARASDVGVEIDLSKIPLSRGGRAWLNAQPDEAAARLSLATGGDDYAIVCAAPPERAKAFLEAATATGSTTAVVGVFGGEGLRVSIAGREVEPHALGWRHGATRSIEERDGSRFRKPSLASAKQVPPPRGVRDLIGEAMKFAMVGGLNTATCLALVWLFRWAGAAVWLASAAGYAVSLGQSYVLNRFWTFSKSSRQVRSGLQFARFLAVNAFCGLIFTGANVALHAYLALAVSSVAAVAIITPISFVLNRWLVFRA